MKYKRPYFYLALIFFFVSAVFPGCSSKKINQAKLDPGKNLANIIAVLPVDNKTKDDIAPVLLRAKIIDELYFRGYTKLSSDFIDRRLEELNISGKKRKYFRHRAAASV